MEKIIIKSTYTEVEATISSLVEKVRRMVEDDEFYFDFKLMLSEIMANALIHGNKKDPEKSIMVDADINVDAIRITVEDEGDGFDVDGVADPSIPSNLSKVSGRGIFLVRSLSDSISFNSKGNSVTFEKIILKKGSV